MSLTPEDVAPLMRDTFTTEQAAWECLASKKVQGLVQRVVRRCYWRGQVTKDRLGDLASNIIEKLAAKVFAKKGLLVKDGKPVGLLRKTVENLASDILKQQRTHAARYIEASALGSDTGDSTTETGEVALEQAVHRADLNSSADALDQLEASANQQAIVAALNELLGVKEHRIKEYHRLVWLLTYAPLLMEFQEEVQAEAPDDRCYVTIANVAAYPLLRRDPEEAHRLLHIYCTGLPEEVDVGSHSAQATEKTILAFILRSSWPIPQGWSLAQAASHWRTSTDEEAKRNGHRSDYLKFDDSFGQYKDFIQDKIMRHIGLDSLHALAPEQALAWLLRRPHYLAFQPGSDKHRFTLTTDMLASYPTLRRPPNQAHQLLHQWWEQKLSRGRVKGKRQLTDNLQTLPYLQQLCYILGGDGAASDLQRATEWCNTHPTEFRAFEETLRRLAGRATESIPPILHLFPPFSRRQYTRKELFARYGHGNLMRVPPHHRLAWLLSKPDYIAFRPSQCEDDEQRHRFVITTDLVSRYRDLRRSPDDAHKMLEAWWGRRYRRSGTKVNELTKIDSTHDWELISQLAYILNSDRSGGVDSPTFDAAYRGWVDEQLEAHGFVEGEQNLLNYARRAHTDLKGAKGIPDVEPFPRPNPPRDGGQS